LKQKDYMYLIISTASSGEYLSHRLLNLNIPTCFMQCVETIPDVLAIDLLKQQINKFDIIIITSPVSINYVGDILSMAGKEQIFIAAGAASFDKLKKYTANTILAPHGDSGARAITLQILNNIDLTQKKIVIIRGQEANCQIQDYLNNKPELEVCTSMIVYHQRWMSPDMEYLKKILYNTSLQGIILTSSMHARMLFEQAANYGLMGSLVQAKFITLHSKIAHILKDFGATKPVLVSDTASHQSLIDLIGRLHDNR
jgi:uroporphyrinogen-III synthase